MAESKRWIFVSLVCQHQNLGDLVIRREMVRWVSGPDTRVVALVGDTPDDALDLIGLPDNASTYRSAAAWTAHLVRRSVTRRSAVVFAPGPQALVAGVSTWARGALSLAYTVVLPPLGNPVVKVGRAVRGDDRLSTALERAAARRTTLHLVRDDVSRDLLGGRTSAIPDVALADTAPTSPGASRDTVTFVARAGRDWPDHVMQRWVDGVRSAGLRPVVVTQVRFDEAANASLAERFGIEHVGWSHWSPRQQLERVDAEYARSIATVGNRLHGLLFASRCGSAPVAWVDDRDDKILPTLRTADLPHRCADADVDQVLAWASTSVDTRADALHGAVARLDVARGQVRQALGVAG